MIRKPFTDLTTLQHKKKENKIAVSTENEEAALDNEENLGTEEIHFLKT